MKISKYVLTTFIFTWTVLGLIWGFNLEGAGRQAFMALAALGPGVGAFLVQEHKKEKSIMLLFLFLGIVSVSYLLRIFRPDFIKNDYHLIVENYWVLGVVVVNIALASLFIYKLDAIRYSSVRNITIGVFFFPIIIAIAYIIAKLAGINPQYISELRDISLYQYVIVFLTTAPFLIFISGGIEELGWRPILQSELQKKLSPLLASVVVGLIWGIWHLPLNILRDEGLGVMLILSRVMYSILSSVILTYFFNKSKSTLQLILLHGMNNVCVLLFPKHGLFWIVALTISAIYFIVTEKMWRNVPEKRSV